MTTKSITSDQKMQYSRFIEDASKKALKKVSPDKDGMQQLIENGGEFQAYLIDGVRRFTAKKPNYDTACKILGKDFISPEDITKVGLGISVVYTEKQLVQFGDTLPTLGVLEWCRDNDYMLVAGPPAPISLLEVRELKPERFYSKSEGWYANDKEKFSRNDKAETRWIMLRKKPVADSTNKNWQEQQPLLQKVEFVPNAAETVWAITMYKNVRDIYLFPKVWVRTSSLDSVGGRVYVGVFDFDGLDVRFYWDDGRDGDLGLASARK